LSQAVRDQGQGQGQGEQQVQACAQHWGMALQLEPGLALLLLRIMRLVGGPTWRVEGASCWSCSSHGLVSKNTVLFEPFLHENDHCTKTGSGQT